MTALHAVIVPSEEPSTRDLLHQQIDAMFPVHPFAQGLTRLNARTVMENYLAMSQAFPFLQAGAQRELIFDCILSNRDVSNDMEQTCVVGSFLCWDETGGTYVLEGQGKSGLANILHTDRYFHANLLKSDLQVMFGEPVKPEYGAATRDYLFALYRALSSLDPVARCAAMVAFELHAERMISSLWGSISRLFAVERSALTYFQVHVGGDDPAEAYHVALTEALVENNVPAARTADFLNAAQTNYRQHIEWCQALVAGNA